MNESREAQMYSNNVDIAEVVPIKACNLLPDKGNAEEPTPLRSVRLTNKRAIRRLYRRLINEAFAGKLPLADLTKWGYILKQYMEFYEQSLSEAREESWGKREDQLAALDPFKVTVPPLDLQEEDEP